MGKKLLMGLVVASVVGSTWWAWADTINWTFSTTGNYTVSDATKVEVADGVAKLIPVDQTDDDNTSTGFSGGTYNETQWDGTNNWLELTATGQTNGSGYFISRVMDAGGTAAWNSISWTPQRPLYKELPNNKGVESGYPTGNANMTGNLLLMHMNEANGAIVDYSGEGNNGSLVGEGDEYGGDGKFNSCMDFDGNDYVAVSGFTDLDGASELSVEMWMKQDQTTQGRYSLWRDGNILINIGDNYGTPGPTNLRLRLNLDGTWRTSHTALGVLDTGAWHHWAFVYDGTYAKIYKDGQQIYSSNADASYSAVSTGSGDLQIGFREGISGLDGLMDEVAIYNRDLSAEEILDHYKRGALRLKYQVRSGSANPPTGNFIGPDSTTGTYYSELSNGTLGPPSLTLTHVDNNQYFQYRAYLETDTSSYSPELKSVVMGPTHFPGDNPTVRNNTWQTYDSLSSFAETLGAGNKGSIKYQISNNGTNWYYWNGSNWVAASGYSQANTASEVNANCGQFDDDIGPGDFYFMAFLHSDSATLQVELDQVDLGYTSKTSVLVSNSTFAFGTNILNFWLTPQISVITNDGTVAENFVGRISQFTDGSNTWGIDASSNGADSVRAQWSINSETGPWTDISAYETDFTIATNVAVNDSVDFWFRIQTPLSTSSYNQHSSNLTVTAQEY